MGFFMFHNILLYLTLSPLDCNIQYVCVVLYMLDAFSVVP